MIPSIAPHEWRRFLWAAVAGAIIFIFTQIGPIAGDQLFSSSTPKVISKSEAAQTAEAFVKKQFHEAAVSSHTIYQTDSLANGYFSKEDLLKTYEDKYDAKFPTDTFQVNLDLEDGSKAIVYVHMTSGSVTGWHWLGAAPTDNGKLMQTAAKAFAITKGFRSEELKSLYINDDGDVVLHPTGYKLGDATLELVIGVGLIDDKAVITRYKPAFQAPASYITYVDGQKDIGSILSVVSLAYMCFISLVLSIIYAILYRRHTTFKRGVFISLVFIVFYIYNNLNVLDGIMASLGEQIRSDSEMNATIIITVVLLIPVGLAVYFALVAGDGMWRSQKRPLWPGFRERGYGEHVWRSVGLSYLFAAVILGCQAIIMIAMEFLAGSWATSDATQSPYNTNMLWLMPMMAWCAAISEEAIFRLFGIALFKKWFKNTFIATLIPTTMWALGHVGYPIFPFYTRIVELVILGTVFCLIFLKYGFITAVFTHAILDSLLMGFDLIGVGGAVNITAAIIYAVLPIIVAWTIKYWHNRRYLRA
ncbi:CPBP family intramembrane glutamic endopeptidase [Paenibacillus sp. YAF4_2]|uniref:CPBP family intramembrane glutamic endopeptidase n=1 Tax=Paenibacillus sp. YAF4_2 TaxID=3233085 RepID=UPI003F97B3E0